MSTVPPSSRQTASDTPSEQKKPDRTPRPITQPSPRSSGRNDSQPIEDPPTSKAHPGDATRKK
jgi:hypothetical protein